MAKQNESLIAFRAPAELERRLKQVCPSGYKSEFIRNAVVAAIVKAELAQKAGAR